MELPKNNIPLVSFIFIATFLNVVVHSQYTYFSYDSFPDRSRDLVYQGAAHVPHRFGNLRLTATDSAGKPFSNSVGRVVYSSPVHFWGPGRQSSFETSVKFATKPNGNNPAGDGITFFMAPVGTTIPPGSAGGNLGVFPTSGTDPKLVAVEFDIYPNEWDPSYEHIGIDVGSRESVNVTRFEGTVGQVVTARINYDAPTRSITVSANSGNQNFFLSHNVDLKTVLPRRVQVGISASTGGVVAGVHEVYSWHFTSVMRSDYPESSILQYV